MAAEAYESVCDPRYQLPLPWFSYPVSDLHGVALESNVDSRKGDAANDRPTRSTLRFQKSLLRLMKHCVRF